ncbi:hypothetical protein ACE1B6_23455 [Aerosakkonemataceae cyanobacterium BLCC-F154]|uniref:Uncharacterized protein n=1 Tax=Floridaenema fluviatile BLCC-F154 TaxID=3153640 RepID=A0ABV4YHB2_9CYAN
MSLQVDKFIDELPVEKAQKEKLTIWKQGLFGTQNELAIANAGLKLTVKELADLVNQTSVTYQAYQDKFKTYQEKRCSAAVNDLQRFLLLLDANIKIISGNNQVNFLTKEELLNSQEYQNFWLSNSINSEPKLGMSLSKIYEEIIKIIKGKSKGNPNLEAFKQGFGEEGRKLLGSKLFLKSSRKDRWKYTFLPVFIIGIFLATTWKYISPFLANFISSFWGGIAVVILLMAIFVVFLRVNQEPSSQNSNEQGNLANIVDEFFSPVPNIVNNEAELIDSTANSEISEEGLVDSAVNSEINEKPIANNHEEALTKFTNELRNKIVELNQNPDQLEWELSRLGQTFRQYYRALVINYADVDLPFIPGSVKQSIASLVKRTRTKIDRTENEVNQLEKEIEMWFDRSMDRSSGVYKRNAKGISLLIGFGLAIVTNSNSIYIANRLAYDEELRQTVVQRANTLISENQNLNVGDRKKEVSEILDEQLGLPIGWNPRVLGQQLSCPLPGKNSQDNRDDWDKLFDTCIKISKTDIASNVGNINNPVAAKLKKDNPAKINQEAQRKDKEALNKNKNYFVPTAILVMIATSGKWLVGLSFLIGWLVTAVAISMGASFWFDLLSKVVNVRNTGNKPPSSANRTSVSSEQNS